MVRTARARRGGGRGAPGPSQPGRAEWRRQEGGITSGQCGRARRVGLSPASSPQPVAAAHAAQQESPPPLSPWLPPAQVAAVESVVGQVHYECIAEKHSSKGAYISVTIGPVWVENGDQVWPALAGGPRGVHCSRTVEPRMPNRERTCAPVRAALAAAAAAVAT